MDALYNEIDTFAASWLDNLIGAGHVANGRVERRSITELVPADVDGPGQRHFFAGIGGWSYALRLAGVPDGADIWTGSCPCQPFSSAGSRKGFDDPRHLWPAWFDLIRECRPSTIFGEQVAGPDGLAWLDTVCADLEGCGYAVGAAVLSAAGAGAPHARHRIYFTASGVQHRKDLRRLRTKHAVHGLGLLRGAQLADPSGLEYTSSKRGGRDTRTDGGAQTSGPESRSPTRRLGNESGSAGATGLMEHAAVSRPQRPTGEIVQGRGNRLADAGAVDWTACDWVSAWDPINGETLYRPIEPGTFPLADGVPARVGRLRGYGNAIVPQVAAAFIGAALEAIGRVR